MSAFRQGKTVCVGAYQIDVQGELFRHSAIRYLNNAGTHCAIDRAVSIVDESLAPAGLRQTFIHDGNSTIDGTVGSCIVQVS
ncbi:hypothetical protein OMF39_16980, partial [Bordetella pertussis]